MGTPYYCKNKGRRPLVAGHASINAIDYLEVLDSDAPSDSPRQRTLLVRCFKNVLALDGDNVQIKSAPLNTPVKVLWALPASAVTVGATVPTEPISLNEEAYFQSLSDPNNVLVVRTDSVGDFSIYTLRLVASSTDSNPPANFDLQLSEVPFSFKVECPSDFDCEPITDCPPAPPQPEPAIDYLSKDYASFRHMMLDRLSEIVPNWRERNPADLGIALVELLAYAGDHLSYYQDAVATEAYLGTARKRVSIRRHARLLDYYMHDGCNARAWVTVQVDATADGKTLAGPLPEEAKPGTLLLTGSGLEGNLLDEVQANTALQAGAQPFETMHEQVLREAHNKIFFYTWGDDECCLPKWATQATLKDENGGLNLKVGDVLIFEEARGPNSGLEADADPGHRHAIRLTQVEKSVDPLPAPPVSVMNIKWAPEDALRFPLCLWKVDGKPVSVARGNVVLVDHGLTRSDPKERLDAVPVSGSYRPKLTFGPLTQQGYVRRNRGDKPGAIEPLGTPRRLLAGSSELVPFDATAPASYAMRWEMRNVQPAIWLGEPANPDVKWKPRRDLLNTDRFTREFVVEVEDNGRASLRFGGDGKPGRRPGADVVLKPVYRVGNGRTGNIGAGAISHIVSEPADLSGIVGVRNPLPAQKGTDPEPVEQVRLYAPQAFRTQERAVTEEDYAAVAKRHPEVQKAAASLRWTGSWHTMFVTVDRKGGYSVDATFEEDMRLHLDRFRMAGHDLEIDGPRFVPLEVALVVCVEPGYFRSDVKQALLETFSSVDLPDGRRGFFHSDNFTFGQPVYLSRVLAVATQIPGVSWINLDDGPTRFGRLGQTSRTALDEGVITIGRLEIARLDNDRNAPESGKIEFHTVGGL